MSQNGGSMRVYQALARTLSEHGVKTMFGLVGDANLYMVDSFIRDCGGTFIASANEAGATLMALGYSNTGAGLGVCSVTHGAAVTNTLTALVQGVKARTPMLLLCGDTPVEDRDNLQNTAQRDHLVATGAGFEQVRSIRTFAEDVATAIRRTLTEKRPVALNIPVEFQWLETEYRHLPLRIADDRSAVPESPDLDDAIGIIAAARRPVILAGRGAVDEGSKAALLRLAARIDAPVATTLKAKDFFRGEDFNLGLYGTLSSPVAAEVIAECDCVIAFEASLNKYTTALGAYRKGKRVIEVQRDRRDIGTVELPDVGVVGHPIPTADLFVKWLDEAEIEGSGARTPDLAERLKAESPWEGLSRPDPSETIDIARATLLIEEAFPQDRALVTDGGRFLAEPWKHLHVPHPSRFAHTIDFGSIGLGMGYAIGVAAATPDVPVLLVTGDGGFVLGGLAEFNTAVRHKVDLTVIICNDGAYGAEHIQFRNKNMDPALAMFDWPDFARVADSLGGRGFSVSTFGELEQALAAVKERDRPILIDLKLDPDQMPSLV